MTYAVVDIEGITKKPILSEDDYETLYLQTGLGKPAVDEILQMEEGQEQLMEYQHHFFNPPDISIDMLSPVTAEEVFKLDEEHPEGFLIAPVQDGDIVITASTNTLGVRHGHAAIVIDAENGKTLEAFTVGQPSGVQNLKKWNKYTTFMILRLKDVSQEITEEIAKFAKENLTDLSYHILAGIKTKLNPIEQLIVTHCSHIVWYAYMYMGYDIDYDKGVIVTPRDIAKSPLLEVVQVYGMDPITLWK